MVERQSNRALMQMAYGHLACGDSASAIFALMLVLHRDLNRVARGIEKLKPVCRSSSINLKATVTDKEGHPVAILDPITVDPAKNDISFTTAPKDSEGNPYTPTLVWSSSDPTVVALELSTDTLSSKGRVNAPGVSTISVFDGVSVDSQLINAVAGAPPTPGTIGLASALIEKGA